MISFLLLLAANSSSRGSASHQTPTRTSRNADWNSRTASGAVLLSESHFESNLFNPTHPAWKDKSAMEFLHEAWLQICQLLIGRCDTCRAQCTSTSAEKLVSAYRCSLGLPVLGMAAAFHTSDIGVDVSSRWGAVRTKGRPSTPDLAFREQYRTMIQNSVSSPIAPRNSISCRKNHRESTTGGYTPPLKDDGSVIERKGFMVRNRIVRSTHTLTHVHANHVLRSG